jgi:hypothetical protein
MSTITPMILASGQLANAKANVLLVAASHWAICKVIMTNHNTTIETVNLLACATGGTSKNICPLDLQLGPGNTEESSTICLQAADKIEGYTTTASKVDYTVTGVDIT